MTQLLFIIHRQTPTQASSDELPLTEAILAGAKKHYATTKVPLILIHTVRYINTIFRVGFSKSFFSLEQVRLAQHSMFVLTS